jgi:hypothetical protein
VDKLITLLAYSRPAYTKRVLEALAHCDGIGEYRLIAFTHTPVREPVLELLRAIDFCERRVAVEDVPAGTAMQRVTAATFRVLSHGFAAADYVIHFEDDVVPARDCLRYFEWAGQAYRADPWIFSVSAYGLPDWADRPLTPAAFRDWASGRDGGASAQRPGTLSGALDWAKRRLGGRPARVAEDASRQRFRTMLLWLASTRPFAMPTLQPRDRSRVYRRRRFTCWGWATWRERWVELARCWPADHWDSAIHCRARGPQFELAPLLSRVQNIGVEGGATPRSADQHRFYQHYSASIAAFDDYAGDGYWESAVSSALDEIVLSSDFLYCRLGHDQRLLQLLPGGRIGAGAAACERSWHLEEAREGAAILVIVGDDAETCRLRRDPDGIWRGRWLRYERMPIELIALDSLTVDRSSHPLRRPPG